MHALLHIRRLVRIKRGTFEKTLCQALRRVRRSKELDKNTGVELAGENHERHTATPLARPQKTGAGQNPERHLPEYGGMGVAPSS